MNDYGYGYWDSFDCEVQCEEVYHEDYTYEQDETDSSK